MKWVSLLVMAATLLCGATAQAQEKVLPVPPIKPAVPKGWPPKLNRLNGHPVTLTPKEKAGVGIAEQWEARPDLPAAGPDGAVTYLFGATMPSVVCRPMTICDIALEPGEKDNGAPQVGDNVRWKFSRAESGDGPNKVVHVIVKPTEPGLVTDLMLATDRRFYVIKLVSTEDRTMPEVRFTYPDELEKRWNEARGRSASAAPPAPRVVSATATTPTDIARLDFAFDLSGDDPIWKPVRVYSNGSKTFIQFPPEVKSDDLPALVALSDDDQEQGVNYRLVGNAFVVDKVLQKAALIAGVGSDQTKVVLTHDMGSHR